MHNSKLFPILRSFTSKEMKEFENFLSCRFFGCKTFVLNYFRRISRYHPHYRDLDMKALFREVYGKRKYNDGLVRRILSDLIKASEDFLMLKSFRGNEIFRNACLLNELRNRGLNDSFRVRSESLVKKLNTSKEINAELLLNNYFVNLEIKEFKTPLRDDAMQKALDNMTDSLSVFFLRSFFSYVNHIQTFRIRGDSDENITMTLLKTIDEDELLRSLEKNAGSMSPYLKLMIYNFRLVKDKNDVKSYGKIMKLLSEHGETFSGQELRNIYVNISKFYNYQNNMHGNRFIQETYELYEFFLKEYYIPSHSLRLQLSFCRNYVNACKSTGNADRIKTFKEVYRNCFPAEHEHDVELFCSAVYEFEKGNFSESLKAASEIALQKAVIIKDVRIIKIKCLYELGYYESVRTETENLKRFLSASETLAPQSVRRGKRFASIVLQLLRSDSSARSHSELNLLRSKINERGYINDAKWLSEKIDALLCK